MTEPEPEPEPEFGSVEAALAAIAAGRLVLVVDDEDRENEGDLIGAAELMTRESLAFMVRHTTGLICVGMTGERLDELQIPLMVQNNGDRMGTAFTVSVDLKRGTSTGVSAADRARTVAALAATGSVASDFVQPGHVFPLRARSGGVLERPGHTEAAADLARLAGLSPAGVLAEVVSADGSMARRPELRAFAAEHGLVMITIRQLVDFRLAQGVMRRSVASLPTEYGDFQVYAYEATNDGVEHLALVLGDVSSGGSVLARVHSECLTGDVFSSVRCDCGAQIRLAMQRIAEEGRGIVVYLRGHEGRGIGLTAKVAAYALQDGGLDTVEANIALGLDVDARTYEVAARILADLGVKSLRLMTNNPEKLRAVTKCGALIADRAPHVIEAGQANAGYLDAKREKLGHLLPPIYVVPAVADSENRRRVC